MHRTYNIIICLICLCTFGQAQTKKYFQQQVNYVISAKVNYQQKTISAKQQITYTNHSADTLKFIYFHVWMNAYKNEATAFAEQQVQQNQLDFYFSSDQEKGYIHGLNFEVDGIKAKCETHSQYVDVIKVNLPQPLPPNHTTTIETPFLVQLPKQFSRAGYSNNILSVTQWYPKPAVYDMNGWHIMPYLDQGEFYSEFGDFHVEVEVESAYTIAASGQLANNDVLEQYKHFNWAALKNDIQKENQQKNTKATVTKTGRRKSVKSTANKVSTQTPQNNHVANYIKYVYDLKKAHDFAFFILNKYGVEYDTLQLKSKIVDVFVYYPPTASSTWKKAVAMAKDATKKYSEWIGDYPYQQVHVVCGNTGVNSGGMEYPTITLITTEGSTKMLDEVIAHEIGHNWFYGALANNERDYTWLDEGINSYFCNRYIDEKYGNLNEDAANHHFLLKKLPKDEEQLLLNSMIGIKKDQPIQLRADSFTSINYGLINYYKAPAWLKQLEKQYGKNKIDAACKQYYANYAFTHVYPSQFISCLSQQIPLSVSQIEQTLQSTGKMLNTDKAITKKIKPTILFNLNHTDSIQYISLFPAVGYNYYDKTMIGLGIHNLQLPLPKLQFTGSLLYATGSKQWLPFARLSFHEFKPTSHTEWAISHTYFNTFRQPTSINGLQYYATDYANYFTGVTRIVPSYQKVFYSSDVRLLKRFTVKLRSFLLYEDELNYNNLDSVSYNLTKKNTFRYINEGQLIWENNRKLYPYVHTLNMQQAANFVRLGFTSKMYFNYAKETGGIWARAFIGKFIYLNQNLNTQYNTTRYHLNLLAPTGNEDYTYSNYFIGRSEYEGWRSQQVIERDGAMHFSMNLLGNKPGRSDNWIAAINLSGKIPNSINPLRILPIKIPLHFFFDLGTYAEAWKDNFYGQKFLYVGGLQCPVISDYIYINFPLIMSSEFSNYRKAYLENDFWKTVTFTIRLDAVKLHRLLREFPL